MEYLTITIYFFLFTLLFFVTIYNFLYSRRGVQASQKLGIPLPFMLRRYLNFIVFIAFGSILVITFLMLKAILLTL